ncbi:insulin receptor [Aedes aegypti]|uniref:receptor protein-tyrosine kinase n=2 Tax=Aedes aegypti TaxID=7159 RepID=A0A1S4FB83_AEDAE|nr:insulin receptor [Aedes aegypti]
MPNLCLYMYVVIFLTLPLVIPKRSRSDTEWVTAHDQNAVDEYYSDENDKLCHNVDIRNNLARLHFIENCTVITGFLQLVLIERVPHEEFVKYNISKLREVTGFVLFFHVYNLRSLRDLFPSLMVIRGRTLIGNYALIFYDLPDLEEIGLKNLIAIQDGFVFVQHCPKLCYTDTIAWSNITLRSNVSIDLNSFDKPDKSLKCNKTNICHGCAQPYCWSNKSCQRFHTGYDFTGKIKCHELCLGGCVNRKDTGCRVCQGAKDGKRCVAQCSEDKVLNQDTMRCITKSQCIDRGGLLYEGLCLKDCPAGFSATNVEQVDVDFSNHTCYPCHLQCPKICEGSQVMYLVDAERLEGCTIINGTLQIRMNEDHPHLIEELRRTLGRIQEIMGYLKVYRSNTLPSLEFLENLEIIHGQWELGHGKYSLMIYENANLQKLWNYGDYPMSLKLVTGSMYFVYNPLLCISHIEVLKKMTNYDSTNDLISADSNGFMQSCNVVSLTVKAEVQSSRNVTIYWTRFNTAPSQQLMGYIIFFTPSDTPRSPYDGRDVCSEYSWQSKLVHLNDTNSSHKVFLTYNLTGLKPFTRYAYYIKTYLTDSVHNVTHRRIGQSIVHYFKTHIARPTPPLRVFTTRKTENSITFSWKILKSEENLVQRYHIDVFVQPDDRKLLDQRNYCLNPREAEREPEMVEECTAEMCCSVNSVLLDVPDFSDSDTDFYSRKKRSVNQEQTLVQTAKLTDEFQSTMYGFLSDSRPMESASNIHRAKRDTENFKNRIYFNDFYAGGIEYTVGNLLPYTYYTFQLFACSAADNSFCSAYSIYSDRTDPSLVVQPLDLIVIKESTEDSSKANSIVIGFKEPKEVNGATVAFIVEIKLLNGLSDGQKSRTECITRLEHERAGYEYRFRNLSLGEYAVRARAVSLAGPERFSDWYFAKVDEWKELAVEDNSVRNGLITFGVLLSLTVGMVGCWVLYHKYKKHHDDKDLLIENDGNEDGFVECDLR